MEWDWFRWVIGGLVVAYGTMLGWIVTLIIDNRKFMALLDKRLAVIESRPHVNPVEYVRAITEVTGSLAALTTQLTQNAGTREEQFNELRRQHEELRKELQSIEKRLDALINQRSQGRVP